MQSIAAVWIVFGLVVSSMLLAMVYPEKTMFANVSSKYCENYSSSGVCYDDKTGSGEFDIWSLMLSNLNSWNLALAGIIGAGLVIGVVTGGLNLLALVPFALSFLLLNFIVLPTGLLTNTGLPEPIPMLIQAFFYLMVIMASISFIRTGN